MNSARGKTRQGNSVTNTKYRHKEEIAGGALQGAKGPGVAFDLARTRESSPWILPGLSSLVCLCHVAPPAFFPYIQSHQRVITTLGSLKLTHQCVEIPPLLPLQLQMASRLRCAKLNWQEQAIKPLGNSLLVKLLAQNLQALISSST